MRLRFMTFMALVVLVLIPAWPASGEASRSGRGVIIGRVEVRLEEERGWESPRLGGVEVDIVREETVEKELIQERIGAKTSDTGVFMAPLSNLKGGFRIARLKLPESKQWANINRVSVEGDVARYGAAYFRRFGRVVALTPLVYERDYNGETRFIMVVSPFADVCADFLEAFPLSPWKSAVEQAGRMSAGAVSSVAERDKTEAGKEKAEVGRQKGPAGDRRPVRTLLSEEEPPQNGGGATTIIITSIVLAVLAILVGVGGRRRHQPQEREIDIAEIERIDAEKEKQMVAEREESEQEEEHDHTAILSQKEGWFLREFRRARVRIHWKKYDSATVSLEKTTGFMEEHIDRLREKKEVYTLVLHYSYLGRCYLEGGRYNDALRVFKRGIDLKEYNSRMCEMGLADTLDAIARSENSPSLESLTAKYPLLSGRDIETILAMVQAADF